MTRQTARIIRGILVGIVAGVGAFAVAYFTGAVPVKVHAWLLLALAVLFAISESHYRSLLSELSALLRRGTYSVGQLEQLNQTVPNLRKRVAFVWALSMWLKAGVGFACALLLWDNFPATYRPLAVFSGYGLLFCSVALAIWGRSSYRRLERAVDALTVTEASIKEKRRLVKELESGPAHDFKNDELANGYSKPATPIH